MNRIVLSLLVLILSSAAYAEESRRLSPEVLWELSRLSTPVVSPDGKRVVVAATTYPEKDDPEKTYTPETRLWLLSSDPGHEQRPLTAEGGSASDPVFSPDGSRLAFVGKRNDDEAGQIYVLPMDRPGEAVKLTDVPTGTSAPRWVGEHIYFVSNVWPEMTFEEMDEKIKAEKDSKLSAKTWNEMPYSYWDHWLDEERQNHLFRIPASGGEVEALTIVAGNMPVEQGSINARYTVELGDADVPVYEGASRPLLREATHAHFFHGPDGMGGMNNPAPKQPRLGGTGCSNSSGALASPPLPDAKPTPTTCSRRHREGDTNSVNASDC
mgnify:CR=1 FL=1